MRVMGRTCQRRKRRGLKCWVCEEEMPREGDFQTTWSFLSAINLQTSCPDLAKRHQRRLALHLTWPITSAAALQPCPPTGLTALRQQRRLSGAPTCAKTTTHARFEILLLQMFNCGDSFVKRRAVWSWRGESMWRWTGVFFLNSSFLHSIQLFVSYIFHSFYSLDHLSSIIYLFDFSLSC